MYDTRDMLLDGGTLEWSKLISIAMENADEFLQEHRRLTISEFNRYLLDNISYRMEKDISYVNLSSKAKVKAYIKDRVQKSLEEKQASIGSEQGMNDFIRVSALSAIDEAWIEQVDYLQQLQGAVAGRSSAQRNLMFEYQGEALESFRKMESRIKRNIIRNVLLSEVSMDKKNKLHIILP